MILRGGTGTLLELACVWEFINKNVIGAKPIIVIGDFWNRVVEIVQQELVAEGRTDTSPIIQQAGSAEDCVRMLAKRL
ncbi:MAG: LOG family protein [Ignavibacteriales bacterium]|nr:LOG family protein [Ignavibacteriales bacterium]